MTKSMSLPTEAAYTVAVRKAATVEVTTKMRQRDWEGTAAAAPALAVLPSAGSLFKGGRVGSAWGAWGRAREGRSEVVCEKSPREVPLLARSGTLVWRPTS